MKSKNNIDIKPGQWVRRGTQIGKVIGLTDHIALLQTEFAVGSELEVLEDFNPDSPEGHEPPKPVEAPKPKPTGPNPLLVSPQADKTTSPAP